MTKCLFCGKKTDKIHKEIHIVYGFSNKDGEIIEITIPYCEEHDKLPEFFCHLVFAYGLDFETTLFHLIDMHGYTEDDVKALFDQIGSLSKVRLRKAIEKLLKKRSAILKKMMEGILK